MTVLADLFTDERPRARVRSPRAEGAQLEALLGGRRQAPAHHDLDADTERLRALVEEASVTAVPASAAATAPARPSARRRRRRDGLTVAASVLAAIAVAGAAALGGVQVATASPTSSALATLTVDEAALANASVAYGEARTRLATAIEEGLDDAAQAQAAFADLFGYTDETLRSDAVVAADAYSTALEEITLPEATEPYARPYIDVDSLPEVGAAIDSVRDASMELSERLADLRVQRNAVSALADDFQGPLAAFRASFPASAAAVNAQNPGAQQSFRDAVLAAADAVSSGRIGASAMLAYRDAVDELRADQLRAEDEARTGTDRSGYYWYGGSSAPTPADPVPTDPVPTDPAPVDPAPTDPAPVDPAPVDPAPVDPAPTEPTP